MSFATLEHRPITFHLDDPTRYDYFVRPLKPSTDERKLISLRESLDRAELRIGSKSPQNNRVLQTLLPLLILEREPVSLEFVVSPTWKYTNDEVRRLHGVIIRGKSNPETNQAGTVLLYAYGIGIDSNSAESLAIIYDAFKISSDDREAIFNATWPYIRYSMVIDLV